MKMIQFYENKIGEVIIEQQTPEGKKNYKIQIRQGNCLAVLIHIRKANATEHALNPDNKYIASLYNFFADEQHIKNIIKGGHKILPEAKSIKLNTAYKETAILLKYLTREGHKVTCYYEPVENETKLKIHTK